MISILNETRVSNCTKIVSTLEHADLSYLEVSLSFQLQFLKGGITVLQPQPIGVFPGAAGFFFYHLFQMQINSYPFFSADIFLIVGRRTGVFLLRRLREKAKTRC